MIVNPEKFQAIIIKRDNHIDQEYILHLKNHKITTKENVKLLGIDIDNKLKFDYHISKICSKASNQLHAISRLENYLGFKEKQVLINSFIYSNFNYCPLIWHFCSAFSIKKIEKIQERALRVLYKDYDSSYTDYSYTAKIKENYYGGKKTSHTNSRNIQDIK